MIASPSGSSTAGSQEIRDDAGALAPSHDAKRHLFVVGSLDKHMENEKELIRLRCDASAKEGDIICICMGSTNLTFAVRLPTSLCSMWFIYNEFMCLINCTTPPKPK